MKDRYVAQLDPTFTPLKVIEEAARCLLCHDAPCSQACPAQTQPDRFIRSVYFRNFKGAAQTIRENNALGAVCARVCPTEKLCEAGCSRSSIDEPIKIGKIQQYVTDFEQSTGMKVYAPGNKKLGKIAIVGSGPAGLQAAVSLNQLGYDVTIYEKEAQAGGWLRYGIPEFRLSNTIVDQEIDRIKETGVTIALGKEAGKDITLEQLKKDNLAVLVAVGFSYGNVLPMFENNARVETAVDFLADAKTKQGKINVPKTALIIGGGDVAMDAATTLKAVGCESVTCVAREEFNEFLASKHELEIARSMNISIIDGFTPVQVKDNEVTFEHVRQKNRLSVVAEKIILAVGQRAQLDGFAPVTHERNIVQTKQYQTNDPQVFAAGDIVQGDKTVVYAVKTGKEAAKAIHQYLQGGK